MGHSNDGRSRGPTLAQRMDHLTEVVADLGMALEGRGTPVPRTEQGVREWEPPPTRRRPFDVFFNPAPAPECVYGRDGRYNLASCRDCPLVFKGCIHSAYRGLNITQYLAHDGAGEMLLDHVGEGGYVVDPSSGEPLIHPVTQKPIKVLVPARWKPNP